VKLIEKLYVTPHAFGRLADRVYSSPKTVELVVKKGLTEVPTKYEIAENALRLIMKCGVYFAFPINNVGNEVYGVPMRIEIGNCDIVVMMTLAIVKEENLSGEGAYLATFLPYKRLNRLNPAGITIELRPEEIHLYRPSVKLSHPSTKPEHPITWQDLSAIVEELSKEYGIPIYRKQKVEATLKLKTLQA